MPDVKTFRLDEPYLNYDVYRREDVDGRISYIAYQKKGIDPIARAPTREILTNVLTTIEKYEGQHREG